MKRAELISVSILLVLTVSGCARSLPLISHSHIGHSLTAWHDTPNQEGLFVVAEQETNTALREAKQALNDLPAMDLAQQHIDGVLRALNPDIRPNANVSNYGAIRALDGSIDHMVFATQTEDASDNFKRSIDVFSTYAASVLKRLHRSVDIAQLAAQSSSSELPALLQQLHQTLQQCVSGQDLDGDGNIGSTVDEIGFIQLRQQLSVMLHKETNPPYHPVGRRYVLGLVRLPNGRWDYRFDKTGTATDRYGGSGGSGSGGY